MLKRLIGKLVVAGLLSGVAIFVAASPSSAARDNPCMDAAHYSQQLDDYTTAALETYQRLNAFENATSLVTPIATVYAVDLNGTTQYYGESAYITELQNAQHVYDQSQYYLDYFVDTTDICP
jgi:hypothetical protein